MAIIGSKEVLYTVYSYLYFKTNNFRAFCIKFSSAGEIWLCYLGCIAPNISHLAPKGAEITKDPQTGAAYVHTMQAVSQLSSST